MYASQTKRLCVRGEPSDDIRVQHHSSSDESAIVTAITEQQQQQQQTNQQNPSQIFNQQQEITGAESNMTTSATRIKCDENGTSFNSSPSKLHINNQDHVRPIQASNQTLIHGATEYELINKLDSETSEETKIDLLLSIRNLITACNRRKETVVNNPNFNKVLDIIDDKKLSSRIKTQLVLLLCSVAKSGERNVKILNDCLVDGKIFNLILNSNDQVLIEAGLRCMRSIMSWPKVSRTWLLYENQAITNSPTPMSSEKDSLPKRSICSDLEKIITFAQDSNSFIIQECVADIFGITCSRSKDQALLYKTSAIPCIAQFLESTSNRVIIATLNWLSHMCLRNEKISLEVVNARCLSGVLILDRLSSLMKKDNCNAMQFLSAQCFTHIYRATSVLKDDSKIAMTVLPTLVRMTHAGKSSHLRIQAAECIAYLIQSETRLQNIASVCDNLIESLADMLDYEGRFVYSDSRDCSPTQYRISRIHDNGISWSHTTQDQPHNSVIKSTSANGYLPEDDFYNHKDEGQELEQEMKRAAFLALASLSSNLESVRKKVLLCQTVMPHLITGLTENFDSKTLSSVLNCLLSLSRSVDQLRTSFAETKIYTALKNLLNTTNNDILVLVLAILCNITLEFSPGKQHFIDTKTIETLAGFTRRSSRILRMHSMWILMNMVYHLDDEKLKFQILDALGIQHIVSLLNIEDDDELILKTLGFLRNLISTEHIDSIMSIHGDQIMQALVQVLKRPISDETKEQCLCVLTNIADGNSSKSYIMSNRTVLEYLARNICEEQSRNLRLAAICCITNLAHKKYEGSCERRDEMMKLGIMDRLKYLLNADDPILSDRVRTAYDQFWNLDDKYVT